MLRFTRPRGARLFASSLTVVLGLGASALALSLDEGCDATVREDHSPSGSAGLDTGAGASTSASASDASTTAGSGGGATGAGGAGGGAYVDDGDPCPIPDRYCPAALTYPLGAEASVEVRGNFTPDGWVKGVPMTEGAGAWVAAMTVPWGIDVQYKFVINGSTWLYDPSNPNKNDDGLGGYNSVLKAPHCEAFLCAPKPAVRFVVIGDFGTDSLSVAGQTNELSVANLVKRLRPDLILTVGDNNYPVGSAMTIDQNIGKYYQEFIFPYKGTYGPGSDTNRFFPTLGNHDWYTAGAAPYLDYFELPGKERYWEHAEGPVRFFGVDSDLSEPDGNTFDSIQGQWLEGALAAAAEPFKVVFMHHPPYSSGFHGSTLKLQWPYEEWGASAVFAGHEHSYERLRVGGMTYIVAGLGGASLYNFNAPLKGSQLRVAGDFGAVLVDVPESQVSMIVRTITVKSLLVDHVAIAP